MRFLIFIFVLFGPLGLGAGAGAQGPAAMLWSPFPGGSAAAQCLAGALEGWHTLADGQVGERALPHRFLTLPEGVYEDQIAAALATGEHPHLLLSRVQHLSAVADFAQTAPYGADLMGLWVDHRALGQVPDARARLLALLSGDVGAGLVEATGALLAALDGQAALPFGLDTGPQGQDLGLALVALMHAWTPMLVDPATPDWQNPAVHQVLLALNQWQEQGWMEEVNVAVLLGSGSFAPIVTLGPYSSAAQYGPDFAFYPLYGGRAQQAAEHLALPLDWHVMRPEALERIEALWRAIETEEVFERCPAVSGLLSVEQLRAYSRGGTDLLTVLNEARTVALDMTSVSVIRDWPQVPGTLIEDLTHTVRDMRAGLSLSNALRALQQ